MRPTRAVFNSSERAMLAQLAIISPRDGGVDHPNVSMSPSSRTTGDTASLMKYQPTLPPRPTIFKLTRITYPLSYLRPFSDRKFFPSTKQTAKSIRLTKVQCRASWTLRAYDVNEAGQVFAYICYLRNLPYNEQLHWRQYNEASKASISERALVNDFKGEFVNFQHPRSEMLSILRSGKLERSNGGRCETKTS